MDELALLKIELVGLLDPHARDARQGPAAHSAGPAGRDRHAPPPPDGGHGMTAATPLMVFSATGNITAKAMMNAQTIVRSKSMPKLCSM